MKIIDTSILESDKTYKVISIYSEEKEFYAGWDPLTKCFYSFSSDIEYSINEIIDFELYN